MLDRIVGAPQACHACAVGVKGSHELVALSFRRRVDRFLKERLRLGRASVTGYWLDAGKPGVENAYYQSGQLPTTATSRTASPLPTAAANPGDPSTVTITLWPLVGGVWQSNTYDYTEAAQ